MEKVHCALISWKGAEVKSGVAGVIIGFCVGHRVWVQLHRKDEVLKGIQVENAGDRNAGRGSSARQVPEISSKVHEGAVRGSAQLALLGWGVRQRRKSGGQGPP